MEEIFKDIVGYEGLYQVSNLGRVKALGNGKSNNSKEKILKPYKSKNGYLKVNLHKESEIKHFLIHRLVAIHFLPNPNNYPCVNHKDENKENNCVDNLEWCDVHYNNTYNERHKKVGEKNVVSMKGVHINRKDFSKEVIQMDLEGNEINRFPSTNEAQRQLGVSQSSISQCCNGKRQTAYGFRWQYA